MAQYINPKIVAITNPVGLDKAIAKAQAKLAGISWLQKIFGRAYIQYEERVEPGKATQRLAFPEVWGRNREPENLMPNDNLRSYGFFIARDRGDFDSYIQGDSQLLLRQPCSFVMWGNLRKINPSRKDRFTEELKRDVLEKLGAVPGLELGSVLEEYNRVFEPFTLTDNLRQYIKPPYYALRIDFNMHYAEFSENCTSTVPANALLNEDGTPILNEDGSYILVES